MLGLRGLHGLSAHVILVIILGGLNSLNVLTTPLPKALKLEVMRLKVTIFIITFCIIHDYYNLYKYNSINMEFRCLQ